MNITVTCNSCGQKLSAPSALAGRRVPCPKCKAPLDVPATSGASPGPPIAVPQAVPENRPYSTQPPVAPVLADAGMIDLGLGAPLAPAPYSAARPAARSKGALVPIIAIIVLLFLVGGGVGAWLMLGSKGGLGSDLRYVPDDSDAVLSADVNGFISSGVGQKVKAKTAGMLAEFNRSLPQDAKFKPEDVGRVTVGVSFQSGQMAGVIHMSAAVTDQDFSDGVKGVKKTVGSFHLTIVDGAAFCRIDDYTIAFGHERTLGQVLERNGPAKLSGEVTAAMNEVDFSKSLVGAASLKNLGKLPPGTINTAMIPGGLDAVRCAALQVDVGTDVRLMLAVICKDANTAEQNRKMADGGIAALKTNAAAIPPAIGKILGTTEISSSGSTVRATATIDSEAIDSLLELTIPRPASSASTMEASWPRSAMARCGSSR